MTKNQLKNELINMYNLAQLAKRIEDDICKSLEECDDCLFDVLNSIQDGELNADEAFSEIVNNDYEFTEPKYLVRIKYSFDQDESVFEYDSSDKAWWGLLDLLAEESRVCIQENGSGVRVYIDGETRTAELHYEYDGDVAYYSVEEI